MAMNRKERRAKQKKTGTKNMALAQARVLFSKEKYHDAITQASAAINENDKDAFNALEILAACYLNLGHPDKAAHFYEKAFELDTENIDLAEEFSKVLVQLGRFEDAAKLMNYILVKSPKNTNLWTKLGYVYDAMGQRDKAAQHYQHALSLKPNFKTYVAIASLLTDLNYHDQALHYLNEAVKLEPDNHRGHELIGNICFRKGDIVEAYYCYHKVLELKPDNFTAMISFGHAARHCMINEYCEETVRILLDILKRKDVDHQAFSILWTQLLCLNPENKAFAEALHQDNEKDPVDLKAVLPTLSSDLCADGLRFLSIKRQDFEQVFTLIRKTVLDGCLSGTVEMSDEIEKFLSALGEHCFLNEYVFLQSDEEKTQVEGMPDKIRNSEGQEQRVLIALLGCYCGLYQHDLAHWINDTYRDTEMPGPYANMLKLQLFDPLEEQEIKKTIPLLENIDDDVSNKVREQYEENPYPRWRSINMNVSPTFQMKNAEVDILVAGCGTGKQPIGNFFFYPKSKITAVDLSLSSLAYAIRKTREYGLQNIDYMQGDILKLEKLGKQFDLIMCSGVLHHMKEPEAGLAVLKKLLKPGGSMNIGLYSEIARKQVVASRELIAEKNWPANWQGVQEFRKYVMKQPKGTELRKLAGLNDFYSTSMCRDLVFHVQEHRYTFPQLEAFFDSQNLKFVNFSYIPSQVSKKFEKGNSDPKSFYDVGKWHEFEKNNPDAFIGMYQMWVCHEDDWDDLRKSSPLTNGASIYQKDLQEFSGVDEG